MRKLVLSLLFFLPAGLLLAQIPSGFVQTTATVPAIANGQYGASWTNLSSSTQLGLLGCTSSFQNTVSGRLDSNGYFSVLLADTAQICPAPSTWTFHFTFNCPVNSSGDGGFFVQVAVTGGGSADDITTQVTAALPSNPCGGSGGGGGTPCPVVSAIQIANATVTGFDCDASIKISKVNHTLNVGILPANHVSIGALGTPTSWVFDTTTPTTALLSLGGMVSFNGRHGVVVPASGDYTYAQITGTPTIAVDGFSAPQEPVTHLISGANTSIVLADIPGVSTDLTFNSTAGLGPNPNTPTITGTSIVKRFGYNDGAGYVTVTSGSPTFTLAMGGTYSTPPACTANSNSATGVVNAGLKLYPITQWATNSPSTGIAAFTGSFTGLTAGTTLFLSDFTTGSFFNGQTVTVLSAGLSPTAFEANFTHSTTTATETGVAIPNNPYSYSVAVTGVSSLTTIGYICHQ